MKNYLKTKTNGKFYRWFVVLVLSHKARCTEIVTNVSPNCTKTDAKSVSSSLLSLQDTAFAIAVMVAVSSQEFIKPHPFIYYAKVRFKVVFTLYRIILLQGLEKVVF